jgi:hypothetical protein
MPASEANTDFPLLKGNKIYRFSVKSVETVDAKKPDAPQGAQNLKIGLSTTKDELDINDNVLHSGFPVTKYIPLYASGDRTAKDIQRDVGTFIKAVEGKNSTTLLSAVRETPEQFEGKLVDGKVTVQQDKTGQYGDSNGVRFIIPE